MYVRQESEYYRAKMKAARRICQGWVKPADLPSNREIRDQIQAFARMHEGDRRTDNLRDMRVEALRLMRILRAFRPRLIGSTMTGHVRQGSDIDLHLFSDSLDGGHRRTRCRRHGLRRRAQTRPQAWRRAGVHAHPRAGPVSLRADDLCRRSGPLRVQELGHRQSHRTGQHRRARAVSGPGISRICRWTKPWSRPSRRSIAFRSITCCCCRWRG